MSSTPFVPFPAVAGPCALGEGHVGPGLLLALVGHAAMLRLREAHTAHGLSPRQFRLLGLLHDRGAMSQRELGLTTDTDPSVLVTMLNPLEGDDLVSRRRDASDRRCHLVTLTAAGEQRLEQAAKAQREAEDVLFTGLDDEQREQLRVLLVALKDGLPSRLEAPCTGDDLALSLDTPSGA